MYTGTGTVNGAAGYRFRLNAIDGDQPGGGGIDKFRIKIWNANGSGIIYDNQLGADENSDPITVLDGGSIVIQKN